MKTLFVICVALALVLSSSYAPGAAEFHYLADTEHFQLFRQFQETDYSIFSHYVLSPPHIHHSTKSGFISFSGETLEAVPSFLLFSLDVSNTKSQLLALEILKQFYFPFHLLNVTRVSNTS